MAKWNGYLGAVPDPRGIPTGFLSVRTDRQKSKDTGTACVIGITPARGGACVWMEGYRGKQDCLPRLGALPGERWPEEQREWLQGIRKYERWDKACKAAGVSRRTWEGWEQGRPMPYHRAALLLWEEWHAEADETCLRHARQD